LEADFDALNAALGPDESNAWDQKDRDTRQEHDSNVRKNTVLSNGNQKFLKFSSGRVCEAYQIIKHDLQPHPRAAYSVWLRFILPSRKIDPGCEDFVMVVLGWYTEYCLALTMGIQTFRKPWENDKVTTTQRVSDTCNFRILIVSVSPNAKVKAILESTLENRCLIGGLRTLVSRDYYSPVRAGYGGLARELEQCVLH
jgi:hypothetical protein